MKIRRREAWLHFGLKTKMTADFVKKSADGIETIRLNSAGTSTPIDARVLSPA
jgi:hypothetical protein